MRIRMSWALYYIGDFVCRYLVNRSFGDYFAWPYRLYQIIMCWAFDLQGDDPRGPWQINSYRQFKAEEL